VPNAIADPEEMRSFALELKRFSTEVQASLSSVQRRFGKLGETWRDQEHAKFADVFGRMLATYVRLADASEKHIPLLLRKAQKIQDYLGPHAGATGRNSAEISSPDVIKEFRVSFLRFEERGKQAVSGVRSDCERIVEWLRHEQLMYWKQELRKSEEKVREARSAYLLARHGADALRKPSYIEEEKALRKAERRKEEAERKIEAVKKWGMLLEQQVRKLMGPINNFAGALDSAAPLARSRLDHMVQNLEDYLLDSPADAGTP
jgi:uncharacterized protein YukE